MGKNRRFRFGSLFIGQIEVNHVNKAFFTLGRFFGAPPYPVGQSTALAVPDKQK